MELVLEDPNGFETYFEDVGKKGTFGLTVSVNKNKESKMVYFKGYKFG
ncbi:hypothetical protein [Bacillus sp. FJAT-49736]|nr:hypothetical protein [Bacillus sp. FJAT-49736]MBS4172633.1 hypothetical protein [Bacillus sp. FJAT-49736]